MKFYHSAALLVLALTSCHSNDQPGTGSAVIDSAAVTAKAPQQSTMTGPAQVAYGFFIWCKNNQAPLDSINIIGDTGKGTPKYYKVDIAATEKYLAVIDKSGLVSKAYLAKWQKYFRQQADSLRVHPQNDGPPNGFDFNLLTYSQEPELYLANPRKAKQHTELLTPNRAVVKLDFTTEPKYPDYRIFHLTRTNSTWLIDSITVN